MKIPIDIGVLTKNKHEDIICVKPIKLNILTASQLESMIMSIHVLADKHDKDHQQLASMLNLTENKT